MENSLILGLLLIGVPLMVLIIMYNGHVNRRNAVDYAFASIDVQLKKRWDLVPNLVNTVKGYTQHEKELFESITRSRRHAKDTRDASENRFDHERQLDQQLPQLIAVAEDYPDLKADQQFLNLQRNLTEIEAQIAAARRAFNASVMNYNNGVDMFPSSLVASLFHFTRRPHFETPAAERNSRSISL